MEVVESWVSSEFNCQPPRFHSVPHTHARTVSLSASDTHQRGQACIHVQSRKPLTTFLEHKEKLSGLSDLPPARLCILAMTGGAFCAAVLMTAQCYISMKLIFNVSISRFKSRHFQTLLSFQRRERIALSFIFSFQTCPFHLK